MKIALDTTQYRIAANRFGGKHDPTHDSNQHPLVELTQALLPSWARSSFSSIEKVTLRTKREHEFALGRKCAHRSLLSFGCSEKVRVASDRSPIWPQNFCGSITHSNQWAWAAVANSKQLASIGIDTESIANPKTCEQLQWDIMTPAEWELINELSSDLTTLFTIVFSAKESFYKCIHPLTKKFFSFHDVLVTNLNESKIELQFRSSFGTPDSVPRSLLVQYQRFKNEIFTATWIRNKKNEKAIR